MALGGENEWHYITTRTKLFTPPVSGNYEIIGIGGGGAGGIHPAVIAPPKLASAGERAPGSHISSVGGSGASGYLRIKLIS